MISRKLLEIKICKKIYLLYRNFQKKECPLFMELKQMNPKNRSQKQNDIKCKDTLTFCQICLTVKIIILKLIKKKCFFLNVFFHGHIVALNNNKMSWITSRYCDQPVWPYNVSFNLGRMVHSDLFAACPRAFSIN